MTRLLRRSALPSALLLGAALWGQDLKEFEKKVTEFTLANGLHFIVVERHGAPEISFHTWVNAGSASEPAGATGLTHLLERMAYKGTETIGTTDRAAEKKALEAVEELEDSLQIERNKGSRADSERLAMLELQLQTAIDQAQGVVRPNEFLAVLESSGATGISTANSYDRTGYFCTLPSNRTESWFLMESQRFRFPVFREFYKEREAAMEEQQTRIRTNARALLQQEFLAAAFEAHPYRNPSLGWPGDLASLRPRDARAFFDRYFVASNMTVAIVGDAFPDEIRRLAERYFGPMPAVPAPPVPHTVEPPQYGPKRLQLQLPTAPMLLCGYKRPDQRDPDEAALRILGLILSNGRAGILQKELVEDQRVALEAQVISAFPGSRYPSLFAFLLAPAKGHTVEENEKALEVLLARLQTRRVDDETLRRARNIARAGWMTLLDGNQALALQLPAYYAAFGDWRKLFAAVEDLNRVTADSVQLVARKYLTPSQRIVVCSVQPPPQAAPATGGRR